MRVRCLSKSGTALSARVAGTRSGYDEGATFPLTPGKDYVVYALAFADTSVWYYLVDDHELWYPVHYPAELFEVIDDRLSRYWRFAFTPAHLDHQALLTIEEWAHDEYFYDRLTDKSASEVNKFANAKVLMDAEFAEQGGIIS
jgi:hypothetical protein